MSKLNFASVIIPFSYKNCKISFDKEHTIRVLKDEKVEEFKIDCFEARIEAGNGMFIEIIK